jgi:hypothetical protein
MHNLPQTFDNKNWHKWNGQLTQGIDSIINKFPTDILQQDGELPTYSMLIAHLNTSRGGLGLLNASNKAAPNFVISMMTCRQCILQGFQINKDTKPINLHYSIADLFDRNKNPTSDCLTQYFQLLPYIAPICHPSKCTENKHIHVFELQISQHSSRGRLKIHCGNILTGQLYNLMATQAPEHLHLLLSILSPQTLYPLVDMNRSNAQH